jgi:hypothetical protein
VLLMRDYSEKLFSLNSSVMDDTYDSYKTANIQINQLVFFFEPLINYLIFELHITCEIYIFGRVTQN